MKSASSVDGTETLRLPYCFSPKLPNFLTFKDYPSAMPSSGISPRAALLTNVVVGTLHPKTILFFVAFSTQFIRADLPYLPQAVALVITFTLIAALTDTLYALSASRAAQMLLSDQAKIWSQRAGGGVLVTAGLAMAALRR